MRGDPFKMLLFYAISLILSLIIVIIAVTALIVLISTVGEVSEGLFYLFLIIVSINLSISGLSLRGIIRSYPDFSKSLLRQRAILAPKEIFPGISSGQKQNIVINPEYFSDLKHVS